MEKIKFKARASQTAILLSEPQSKADKEAGKLSKSAISMLEDWVKEHYFNRRPLMETSATIKGTICEDQSIAILNKHLGTNYKKHFGTLENEWMTGHMDILGDDHIRDTKTCETFDTFPLFGEEPEKAYDNQLQAYMWMAGEKYTHAFVDKVLCNSPDFQINRKLFYLFNDIKAQYGEENSFMLEEYDEKAYQIFKQHVYDDTVECFSNGGIIKLAPEDIIPIEQRVKTFRVERNQSLIEKIPTQVEKCRIWLKKQGY